MKYMNTNKVFLQWEEVPYFDSETDLGEYCIYLALIKLLIFPMDWKS